MLLAVILRNVKLKGGSYGAYKFRSFLAILKGLAYAL